MARKERMFGPPVASTSGGTDNKTATENSHTHTINSGNTSSAGTTTTAGFRFSSGSTGNMSANAEGHVTGFSGMQMGTAQGVSPTGNMKRYGESKSSQMNQGGGDKGYSLQIYVEHTHSITSLTGYIYGKTDSGSAHSHTAYFTGTAGTTGDGGFSNTAVDKMPPYICKYCWERTA